MTAIEIRELVVRINGFPTINGLNLQVDEGESIGIISEKSEATTILKVLCGLELPDSGEIWAYNLPPRQALLRVIIYPLIQKSSESQPFLIPLNFAHYNPGNNTFIQIIEIFDKIIQNNYKSPKLIKGGIKQ